MKRFDYDIDAELHLEQELELMANQMIQEDSYAELGEDDFEPMPSQVDAVVLDPFGMPRTYVRFLNRTAAWVAAGRTFPRLRHYFWWVFHNCFAHVFFGLAPCEAALDLHNWSSMRMNLRAEVSATVVPVLSIHNYVAWCLHNTIFHLLIGFFPCNFTFRLHDITAGYVADSHN